MRKIKEALRLCWELGLSVRQTARSVGVAGSTVSDLLYRAKAAGLEWPLPESLTTKLWRRCCTQLQRRHRFSGRRRELSRNRTGVLPLN